MPWFGMDIGGTLTKLVYFEPTDDTGLTLEMNGHRRKQRMVSVTDEEERETLATIHRLLRY